jgi:hypothetical protein
MLLQLKSPPDRDGRALGEEARSFKIKPRRQMLSPGRFPTTGDFSEAVAEFSQATLNLQPVGVDGSGRLPDIVGKQSRLCLLAIDV